MIWGLELRASLAFLVLCVVKGLKSTPCKWSAQLGFLDQRLGRVVGRQARSGVGEGAVRAVFPELLSL